MILKRINFFSKKIYFSLLDSIANFGLSINYLVFILISALAVVFLTYNIYKTVRRAEVNYMIKQQEQEQRDVLSSEIRELDDRIEYLNSVDAKRNMAVEGYKMTAPGETLYEVKEPEVEAIYIHEQELEPIDLADNRFWWEVLVFGE